MPEGPEAVIITQYLSTKIKNKEIESIKIISGRYTHQKLKGFDKIKNKYPLKIKNIDSKGKFIWFEMIDKNDNPVYLMNGLGMTGGWSFYEQPNSRLVFHIFDPNKNKIKKYYNLYYTDQRNFGTLQFTNDDSILEAKKRKLAPDILKDNLSDDDIVHLIYDFIKNSRKDKNIVKSLIDQDAIVSGIGNYLVAEILYDAKISPYRNLSDLSNAEVKTLAHSIRKLAKYAYYNNTTGYMQGIKEFTKNHSKYIKNQKFPNYHPDIKGKKFKFKIYKVKSGIDPYGNPIQKNKIIKGRTIYWVPAIQK